LARLQLKKVTTKYTSDQEQPEIVMTKHILMLAAVLGFIAQTSVFAADPTPTPTPKASHHKKHHKKAAPEASPSPSATPKAS
jgi:hypothetical protein